MFSLDFTAPEVKEIFEYCERNAEEKSVSVAYPSIRLTSYDDVSTELFESGAVLIGEAAHSFYPPYGFVFSKKKKITLFIFIFFLSFFTFQNESLGIEDAYLLAKHFSNNGAYDDINATLLEFQNCRKKRIPAIAKMAMTEHYLSAKGKLGFINKMKLFFQKGSSSLKSRHKKLIEFGNVFP